MLRYRIALVSLSLVAVAACAKKDAPADPAAGAATTNGTAGGPMNPLIESANFAPSLEVNLAQSAKSASGLYYRDLQVGTGDLAVPGKAVEVKYDGRFLDGTSFESSVYPFRLGSGRVIQGWDEGITGMKVGGKRQLIIPPDMAYGAAGFGKVPPNAILVFTVELLAVK